MSEPDQARRKSRAPGNRAGAPGQAPEDRLAALGARALRYVRPGRTIGLGTGHAASAFIRALGAAKIPVQAIATSRASEELARQVGVAIASPEALARLDLDVDGADEVDRRLNLIKGYGGAMVREKIVAAAARRVLILVGEEKLVARLGRGGKLPVEVLPFALPHALAEMRRLGLKPQVRRREEGGEFLSDNGNLVVDCVIGPLSRPAQLERQLGAIAGVVGTGLFLGIADTVLVATRAGAIRVLGRGRR